MKPSAHSEEEKARWIMPFGFDRGAQLVKLSNRSLESTRGWCRDKEDHEGADFSRLIERIDEILEDRKGLPLGLEE
jgi:hypothetical protein